MLNLRKNYSANVEEPTTSDGALLKSNARADVSRMSLEGNFTIRPSSAPACPDAARDIYIPPRRTLPPTRKNRAQSTAQPVSPLPKPTIVDRTRSDYPPILPPKIFAVEQQNDSTSKTESDKPSPQQNSSLPLETIPEEQQSPLAAKSARIHRPASASAVLESKSYLSKKRPPPGEDAPSLKRARMIDIGIQVELQETSLLAPEAATSSLPCPSNIPQDSVNEFEKYLSKLHSSCAPREVLSTPAYRNATQEERDVMLNNFICENLRDENFLQLCVDMEKAWRRLGLEVSH